MEKLRLIEKKFNDELSKLPHNHPLIPIADVDNLVCPFCGGSPTEKVSGENHCHYCDKYW